KDAGTMKTFGAWQIIPIGVKSRTGSQRITRLSEGLVVKNVVTSNHVYPSGSARATSSAAIEPFAPDFDSIMIEAFHCVARCWGTRGPNTSPTLPTEEGLTTRTGRLGKLSCAFAAPRATTIGSNAAIIAPRRFVIAIAYPALPAVFKRSACGQDADNHPAGQGSP